MNICGMFLLSSFFDIASYLDDDDTLYKYPTEVLVKTELEISSTNLFRWFWENHLKSYSHKCHKTQSCQN